MTDPGREDAVPQQSASVTEARTKAEIENIAVNAKVGKIEEDSGAWMYSLEAGRSEETLIAAKEIFTPRSE
jgi:hypothetical protein